jgi:methoxymalonate biosynthesis acyl carrier protein
MRLEDMLKSFIEETLVREGGAGEVAFDEPLFDRGVLDSMGMLNLISFLEERTGVRVPDDDVLLENFATINAIVSTVDRLKEARRTAR